MKIKTTLGAVRSNLEKAIEVSRQNMEYGSYIETSGSLFSRVEKKTPIDFDEYWFETMSTFHPWNEFKGIFNAAELFNPDTEVWISCEAAGKINILLKKGGYK